MRTKTTFLGKMALIVVVGAVVAGVGSLFLKDPPVRASKTLQWEHLEGEEGTDLQRIKTPKGWIVEGADGYLVIVKDPEHEWLPDE